MIKAIIIDDGPSDRQNLKDILKGYRKSVLITGEADSIEIGYSSIAPKYGCSDETVQGERSDKKT